MKASLFAAPFAALCVANGAVGQTLPVERYPFVSGPVTITSCSVNENKSNSTVTPNSLRINYYDNTEGSKLTSITFRVRYAQTPVTITDTGTFEYKQSITHQFNQLGGLPWVGAMPTMCRVLTATFADGKVVNPAYAGPDDLPSTAPHAPAALPSAPGDAMAVPAAPPSPGEMAAPPAPPAPGAPAVPPDAPAPPAVTKTAGP